MYGIHSIGALMYHLKQEYLFKRIRGADYMEERLKYVTKVYILNRLTLRLNRLTLRYYHRVVNTLQKYPMTVRPTVFRSLFCSGDS